jgi:hypothetical protein
VERQRIDAFEGQRPMMATGVALGFWMKRNWMWLPGQGEEEEEETIDGDWMWEMADDAGDDDRRHDWAPPGFERKEKNIKVIRSGDGLSIHYVHSFFTNS